LRGREGEAGDGEKGGSGSELVKRRALRAGGGARAHLRWTSSADMLLNSSGRSSFCSSPKISASISVAAIAAAQAGSQQ
jgi:hypothetical protein